jgi:hypothetical protein
MPGCCTLVLHCFRLRLCRTLALAFWMQTTGEVLLAVRWCSWARVRMTAQDGRSARGLLYLAAVRDDRHRSVGVGKSSRTVCHRSRAGPIFQSVHVRRAPSSGLATVLATVAAERR